MAISQECPSCHVKQKLANKKCSKCGEDLQKAKRSNRVIFWTIYRVPGNPKKYYDRIGTSIEDAKAADGKRKVQKKENRIFEMIPESEISFSELTKWYVELESVRALAMYQVQCIHLKVWNETFGPIYVNRLKLSGIQNFQAKHLKSGKSRSYVDQIVGSARTMIIKAFEDDMISGDCLRPFKKTKKLLKKNANARDLIFSKEQYEALYQNLPGHLKPIVATAYWTGMRLGEILNLTWDRVFLKEREIRLAIEDTKDNEQRIIPLFESLHKILSTIPRAIHDEHVFLFKGQPLSNIREGFKAGMKRAGIPYGRNVQGGLTFHDLRHTFNTDMRRAGVPEKLIMQITGHSTREMFDRYNTITADDRVAAEYKLQNIRGI